MKFNKALSHQVTPPDASSMMGAQGELDNLFQSGNINKAMQMAFAVLSANTGRGDAHSVSSLDLEFLNILIQINFPKFETQNFVKNTQPDLTGDPIALPDQVHLDGHRPLSVHIIKS